ncbi:MAG TPA: 3-methyl-2-oxobutanoate hydroxymethyltransferase, partial [Planctomycetaceae bacterium]|nr:3-methyl-2-oxobutanoate hydroxymethyltransferase [Planctomycetaceae bacterium]
EIVRHVEAVVRAGIPVLGHIGLTPQDVLQMGGYRVQGRSPKAAGKLLDDARSLADRGVFAIVLECVPSALAAKITEAVDIPTIGIGAGPHCDGQILVLHDILGMYAGRPARFVKRYADIGKSMRQAVARYAEEVRKGVYPDEEHSYE